MEEERATGADPSRSEDADHDPTLESANIEMEQLKQRKLLLQLIKENSLSSHSLLLELEMEEMKLEEQEKQEKQRLQQLMMKLEEQEKQEKQRLQQLMEHSRRRKLQQALSEGHIFFNIIKCLFQGPPWVGKTHIKCLLLKKKLEQTLSTPCIEHPHRAIRKVTTQTFAAANPNEEKEEWEILDDELLAQIISNVANKLNITFKDGQIEQTKEEISQQVIENLDQKLSSIELQQKLSAKISQTWQGPRDMLFLIDSGGQPQFQEVLQAFIPNTTLLILAFDLTQKLSEAPLMKFETDEGSHSLGRYAISNEEIISRFARMVYSSNKKVQVALVGTHYDQYSPAQHEHIDTKNARLLEIFSFCKDRLLYYDLSSENLLFPINGLQAEEGVFDDPVVCSLRKCIGSTANDVERIEVPIRWYAFEMALQKSAESSNYVLPIEQCRRIAADLEFPDKEAILEALKFLAKYNLILYYPEILPDVVFTTPQVLLDKVTELTECVYKLANASSVNVKGALPSIALNRGEYLIMKDEGIISQQILRDFPKYYAKNLFTEEHLVKIFEHLYIIARLQDGRYFMPSLLPPFLLPELKKLFDPSKPPLLFHFNKACAPTGLFCALLVCLTSPSIGWEICRDLENIPLQGVRSNAACLRVPNLRFLIMMVDSYYQFEVHYDCPPGDEKFLPQIRERITEALEEVIHNRKFNFTFPMKAFFCHAEVHKRIKGTPPQHVCIPGPKHNMPPVCSIDPLAECEMMKAENQWLAELPDEPSTSSSSPTISQLHKCFKTELAKWKSIGCYLEVPPWKLAAIELKERDPVNQLMLTLDYWKKNAKPLLNPFTWETVVEVLRDVDNNAQADMIEKKYLSSD